MILKQLNLGYFTNQLGLDSFNLFKSTYKSICQDGHFDSNINDKEVAALLFEQSMPDNFFESKSNLISFCHALPDLTQRKILVDLGIQMLDELRWDIQTSTYFVNILELNSKFSLKVKNQQFEFLESVIEYDKPEVVFKSLKDYQSGVFFPVYDYISQTPFARCIIQMPTGSGKTRTAMEIVCETLNDKKRDVLWLANTQELCDQAFGTFTENWHFLRKIRSRAINHIRLNKTPPLNSLPTFHVSSLQGLSPDTIVEKLKKKGIDRDNLELVIVDEAHISIAPTYRKTIDYLIQGGAKLIGLTATPGRQLKNARTYENRELSDFYFNKLFELNTGDELPIEYLRSKGILSNAKFVSIEGSKVENILSLSEIANWRENKSIPKKIETMLTNDVKRNAIIFDQLVQLLNKERKIIFFATSIEHSKLMTALLNLKGFKAQHLDGNSGKYRTEIITSFKNNETQILCNYGVLSTGFDDPKIDVVFMARPTNSIVLYSQIIGRGLRGPVIGGTDYCEIYTVFDNILDLPENNEIYSYFDEYFD
jgi:superfamily II DNA or RNA helicase